jgi:hypothetical protein
VVTPHLHRHTGGSHTAPWDWAVALCHEHAPTAPGCQPAVLDRHVYLDPTDYSTFQHMEYRAACHGCDWIGDIVPEECAATELAHDHAFPGWRNLPALVPARPYHPQRLRSDVLRFVGRLYPPGWIERHGPTLVVRSGRSVPVYSPTGGFEMAIEGEIVPADQTVQPATQDTLF